MNTSLDLTWHIGPTPKTATAAAERGFFSLCFRFLTLHHIIFNKPVSLKPAPKEVGGMVYMKEGRLDQKNLHTTSFFELKRSQLQIKTKPIQLGFSSSHSKMWEFLFCIKKRKLRIPPVCCYLGFLPEMKRQNSRNQKWNHGVGAVGKIHCGSVEPMV
jgi:hypothetical protein